jgi:hypothetical protein
MAIAVTELQPSKTGGRPALMLASERETVHQRQWRPGRHQGTSSRAMAPPPQGAAWPGWRAAGPVAPLRQSSRAAGLPFNDLACARRQHHRRAGRVWKKAVTVTPTLAVEISQGALITRNKGLTYRIRVLIVEG